MLQGSVAGRRLGVPVISEWTLVSHTEHMVLATEWSL
jgi:hypothetical protein